jgi:UDP-glucuronate 4-epimerase
MHTICITGLAGFIGFHTALALAKRGKKVVGFDNFDPYYSPQLKKDRMQLLQQLGINCESIDLSDSSKLEHFFDQHQPEGVIHLAAQAGVRYSIEQPKKFIESNVTGFVNLLEILKNRPNTPFIYASSSSVYGMNRKAPFHEEDRTDHSVSLYGATKKCNEVIGYAYHHLYKIPMTGLRFFTVYGPWGRPDMAYWLFTEAIFNQKPIKLFNEGRMQRDFTYVDDIVQGILASLEQSAPFAIYNLGGNTCHDLRDFVAHIEKAAGIDAILEFLPMQAGDVCRTHADISLGIKDLHFIPRTSLEEGIPQFVNWYKRYHQL